MNQLVTPADHDAGFKEIEVIHRSGRRETIKLAAPSHRAAQKLALEITQTREIFCVVEACLPADSETTADKGKPHSPSVEISESAGLKFLNKLTHTSAGEVEAISLALTFGDDFQKKMLAIGERMHQQTASTTSGSSAPLSEPVILSATSGNFPCRNCGSTIGYAVSLPSSATSAPPASPPPPA